MAAGAGGDGAGLCWADSGAGSQAAPAPGGNVAGAVWVLCGRARHSSPAPQLSVPSRPCSFCPVLAALCCWARALVLNSLFSTELLWASPSSSSSSPSSSSLGALQGLQCQVGVCPLGAGVVAESWLRSGH